MKRIIKMISNEVSDILKPLGIPVYFLDSKIPNRILQLILDSKVPEIRKTFSKFTRQELSTEISNFYSTYMFRNNFNINNDKFLNDLSVFLENMPAEKTYEAIIYIPGIFKFPHKRFNSDLETIAFSKIKEDPSIQVALKFLQKDYKDLTNEKFKSGLWIRYTFKSIHPINSHENIRKYCINEIEDFLGIVSILCSGATIDTNKIIGFIKGDNKVSEIQPEYSHKDWLHLGITNYPAKRQQYNLSLIRKILNKKRNTSIEKKLLAFSRMFLLYTQSNSLELKHIILISGIESLLLSGEDKYYIGDKTAEKTAVLIGDSANNRIQIYHFMKQQYAARSKFVHEGKSNVNEGDVRELEVLALRLFYKQLRNSTIYTDFSGDKGLDTVFLKAKFK